MNKTSATVTVVMCALGLAAGYAANRQVPGGEKSANAAAVAKPAKQDLSQTTAAEKLKPSISPASTPTRRWNP